MELWDAYDRDGKPAGVDLVRGEPIPEGYYHKVVNAIVRHREDGRFLLMRRDPRKEAYPGVFEVSGGGSVLKGETQEAGIRREIAEETGITDGEFSLLYTEVRGKTLYYGYLCMTSSRQDAVRLQEGETTEFRWLTPGELRVFAQTHPDEIYLQKKAMPYLEQAMNADA